jgi:predicted RND superfamily exporter protein
MTTVARLIVRRPRTVVALTLLVTAGALYALGALALDNSTERLLVRDSPAARFLDEVREAFGGDETLFVILREPDVTAPAAVRRLQALTKAVGDVPEVERVMSLTSINWPWPRADDVAIEPLFGPDGEPTPGAPLAAALAHPLIVGNLMSADHRAAAVLALVSPHPEDPRFKGRLIAHVEAAVAAAAPGADVTLGGAPYAQVALNELTGRDLRVLGPVMLAVMAVLLFLTYRSAYGVFLPVGTVVISLLWTIALAAVLGRSLSIVSSVLPPLVLAIGTSYTIRVLSEYHRQRERLRDRGPALEATLREVGLTVMLCGATTALGFGSLLSSRVEVIRDLGLLATIGSAFTTLTALTLVPAMLALLPAAGRIENPGGLETWLRGLLPRLHAFTVRRGRLLVGTAAAVMAVGLSGLARLSVDQDPYSWFPPRSPTARSTGVIDHELGGIVPFGVVLESPDGVYDPALVRAASAVAAWLRSQPEIGAVVSPADHLALVHAALAPPGSGPLPGSRDLVAQYLLLFDTRDPEQLAPFVHEPSGRLQVAARLEHGSSRAQRAFVARLEAALPGLVPAPLTARVTGTGLLRLETNDALTSGLFTHLVIASFAIAVLLAVALRSIRLGTLALVPNLGPILVVYGLLGWLAIPLNAATVTTGAAALGNAVDDTVQYLDRYRRRRRAGYDPDAARRETLEGVGAPMIVSDVVLTVGFGALLLSSFFPVASLGLLGATGIGMSLLANLFVLPLVVGWRRSGHGLAG